MYGGESDEGYGKALRDANLLSKDFTWSLPDQHPTIRRVWHTATTIPHLNALFVFGGESYNTSETPEILGNSMVLDMHQNIFYPPATTGKGPGKRSGHAACLIHDDIIIFGGIARRSWLGDMYALNIKTWKWRLVNCLTSSSSKSSATSSAAAASTASTAWSLQHPGFCMDPANIPKPRSYSTFTSLKDGRALLFGGNNDDQSFNACEILDTTRGQQWRWVQPTTSGTPPCKRTGHAATHLTRTNGHSAVLVHGGWDPQNQNDVGSQLQTFSDCFVLDVETMVWSSVVFHQLEISRVGHSICFLEETRQIVVYGGQGNIPQSERHSDFRVLDYDTEVQVVAVQPKKAKRIKKQAKKAKTIIQCIEYIESV